MDTRTKVTIGVLAGLIAGATLAGAAVVVPRMVGAALAGPRMMGAGTDGAYGMMRWNGGYGAPDRRSGAEMYAYMERYRTSSGSIDYDRMHADLASGEITPPCLGGTAPTGYPRPGSRRGGMMGGRTSGYGPGPGYGMMGPRY